MNRRQLLPLTLLCSVVLVTGCKDDAEPLPSYKEDLACLVTGADARATTFLTDDGRQLRVSNSVTGLKADTLYRVLALYRENEVRDAVWLTSYARILTPEPRTYRSVKQDPLSVVATWKSGGYVNYRLQTKGTYNGTHYFGFHRAGTIAHADGSITLQLKMVHDQNNDPLYYSRETYLSLPLSSFDGILTHERDSVSIEAPTFDGTSTCTYAY